MVVVFVFLAIGANHTVFSQALPVDAAVSNAVKEIAGSVPGGTKIAVVNISSDNVNLSDDIINGLISNLANTKLFQIVPRSTLEAAFREWGWGIKMSDNISEESVISIGKSLDAGTVITGTLTAESENSYRLTVNAFDVKNFAYQTSYRTSIRNNSVVLYEDYTVGERMGMGFQNIFFGVGSIARGHYIGFVPFAFETVGALICTITLLAEVQASEIGQKVLTFSFLTMGVGVVFGFVLPFFHHKPNNTNISESNRSFPFNIELASTNNRDINDVKLSYTARF
jgi:TolB-like protein